MGFSWQEYWSGLPFPSPVDHIVSYLSTMTLPSWVAPRAWLSFIKLDKAVVLMWLNWLVSCEYGFSVSALWCPLATPTLLLGFLLPSAWGISSRLLQQSAAAAPYLGRGVSPIVHVKKRNMKIPEWHIYFSSWFFLFHYTYFPYIYFPYTHTHTHTHTLCILLRFKRTLNFKLSVDLTPWKESYDQPR